MAVAFGFILIAFFVMVGALGLAIAVGLTALLAMPPWRNLSRLFPLDLAHSVFLIFIAWAWASTIWSPFDQTGLVFHILGGALLYPLFVYGVFTLSGKARHIVILTALISAPFMLAPYLIEGTTGLISNFYEEEASRGAMLRDATRGISAIVMATPALAALCVLVVTGRKGWIIAAIGVLLIALVSVQFHLFAALIGLILGGIIFAAGYKWPRSTILIVTLSFLIMLLLAPMIMPVFAAPLDGMHLPFSWEWRVKMWPYTGQQINLHPLFGWGLEASRTFTEDHFKLRGFTLSYLVQHPHNVGLQVWLETGLIGALLLSTAIALFGIRLSSMPGLARLQGAAISSSGAIILIFFSFTYGAWQEWLWACIAWVAALCVLVGTPRHNEGHP